MFDTVDKIRKSGGKKETLSRTTSALPWVSISEEEKKCETIVSIPDRSFTIMDRDSVSPTSDLPKTPDSLSLAPSRSASGDTLCSRYAEAEAGAGASGDVPARPMQFTFSEDDDLGVFV